MKPRRRTTAETPGSTMKVCVSCMQHIRVACKICRLCGAQQVMKKSLKANEDWTEILQKGSNAAKLVDAAQILIHKFQMAGFHPLLLFGHAKTTTVSCDYLSGLEVVTGQEQTTIQTIQGLYESLLKVIVKRENNGREVDPEGPPTEALEEDGTSFLTPCDPAVKKTPQPSTSSTPMCPPPKHTVLPSAVRKVIIGEEDPQEDWSSGLDQEDPGPPHIKEDWSSGLDQEDPGPPHIKEDQQEEDWSSSLDQEDPGPPHIKEDQQEEDWSSGLDQEDPGPPHIKEDQQEEDWSSGLDYGGPGPTGNSSPDESFQRYAVVGDDWQEPRGPPVPGFRRRTGEKPFGCSECEKRFTERRTLKRHMRIHTGAKPYSCFACDKSFSWRESLQNHMLSHTGEKPHRCSVCEKSFTLSAPLRRHMLTHTGEKPHSCSLCEKAFTQSSNLRSHMLTHTGERPHNCSACGKGFRTKKVLEEHVAVCGKISEAATAQDDSDAARRK